MPGPPDDSPLRALLLEAARLRQPVSGTFELTSRCNLACGMCYIREAGPSACELSTGQWVRLATEAAGHGMVFLLLTGGEVFLRPDFFQIYAPVRALGLHLILFTNGTLITPDVAARLAACPPNRVEITLYGASDATYDAVTGVTGSYARCLAGIENLLRARVTLALKATLTRGNLAELDAMRRLAAGWGIPLVPSWFLGLRRDGKPSAAQRLRLTPPECVALQAAHSQVPPSLPVNAPQPDRNSAFFCHAGKNSFVITPRGEMNACIDLPWPAAAPLETGFAPAWKQVQDFVESVPPPPICHSCSLEHLCGWCPGFSWTETGRLNAPVPFFCEIAAAWRDRLSSLPAP